MVYSWYIIGFYTNDVPIMFQLSTNNVPIISIYFNDINRREPVEKKKG
jgi:hypothetical protein